MPSSKTPSVRPPAAPPQPHCTVYKTCDVKISLTRDGLTFAEGGNEVPLLPSNADEAEEAAKILELAAAHLRASIA
ncbi:MAG TPA: hypothetical protein VN436_09925 [Holophaga sp.]|nr:hypothetical protein [Holophaga sp.]